LLVLLECGSEQITSQFPRLLADRVAPLLTCDLAFFSAP
jgi:hypothetical protein